MGQRGVVSHNSSVTWFLLIWSQVSSSRWSNTVGAAVVGSASQVSVLLLRVCWHSGCLGSSFYMAISSCGNATSCEAAIAQHGPLDKTVGTRLVLRGCPPKLSPTFAAAKTSTPQTFVFVYFYCSTAIAGARNASRKWQADAPSRPGSGNAWLSEQVRKSFVTATGVRCHLPQQH